MHADAQTHAFAPQSWDALFSRFGVMFFADPPAAFANMRRALKPGGRMTFVCWRTPAENPLMTAPMQAALPILGPPEGPPADPRAPGPFAFAAQDYVAAILSAAGFAEAHFEAFDAPTRRGDLEDILAVSLKIGPLGARLRERPDMAPKVIEAVRAALAAHMGPDGLNLNSGAWIVSARNRD
jgi:SAM-dependent methyltransferase